MSEMEAGREMDAMIAERVFGLRVKILHAPEHKHQHGKHVPMEPQSCDPPPGMMGGWAAMYWVIPHYSTSIADAWEVVEKMRERGWVEVVVGRDSVRCEVGEYGGEEDTVSERADTAPLAICRAAIRALGLTHDSVLPTPEGERK